MRHHLKLLKGLLPPLLSKFLMKNLGYLGLAPWRYLPEGFSYVTKSEGWHLDDIAKLQFDKWEPYAERIKSKLNLGINHESESPVSSDPFFHNLIISFAYVISLSAVKKERINFLDWGGGIGHYGLLAEELLRPSSVKMEYYNFDFPAFRKYGQIINPKYNFFSNFSTFNDVKFDLVMASSSIWYEQDWRAGVSKLCSYDFEYIYITRMIFIEKKPSFVALQRPKYMGYDTEYLFWVINKSEFIAYLEELGMSLIREFEFGEVTPIFKAPEQGTMKGFLFKKITLNGQHRAISSERYR